jgi:hypothetical protein
MRPFLHELDCVGQLEQLARGGIRSAKGRCPSKFMLTSKKWLPTV